MQSLASLMSVKASDVGNLDDFVESDEEAEGRSRGAQPGVPTACGELGLAKTLGCSEGSTMFPMGAQGLRTALGATNVFPRGLQAGTFCTLGPLFAPLMGSSHFCGCPE